MLESSNAVFGARTFHKSLNLIEESILCHLFSSSHCRPGGNWGHWLGAEQTGVLAEGILFNGLQSHIVVTSKAVGGRLPGCQCF